jgi:hypothetical protein
LENLLSNAPLKARNGKDDDERMDMTGLDDSTEKRMFFEKHIQKFNDACSQRNVLHAIHRDRGIPTPEIIEESRFADIVIIDPQTSFRKKFEGAPTRFVKSVLENAECPVILSPENFEGIEKIVFTYDGGKSCVFAIKQFTHLFPQLTANPVTILQINSENDAAIHQKYKLKEWLKTHYDNIDIETLQGDPKYNLVEFVMNERNIFLVMGAYGKSILSQFFHVSHADLIIKTADVPLFIAHY